MIDQFAQFGASDQGAYWFNHQNLGATIALAVCAPTVIALLSLLPATRRWCLPHAADQYG